MFKRSGSGNYAYTSARVKAKKSKLLKAEDYNKMVMMTVPEISHYISDAGYGKELTDFGNRYSGLQLLEYATYANMAKAFRSILDSSTGELRNMVSSYLHKWDFENFKTIMRGKNYGLPVDEIKEDLVPAGSLKEEDFDKLLNATSIEDAITYFKLKTGLKVTDEIITAYKNDGVLRGIEDMLTMEYYRNVLASIDGNDRPSSVFRTYIRYVIDAKNIETLLKLQSEGVTGDLASIFFIPGGFEVDQKVYTQIANAADVQSAITEMQSLRSYAEIKDSLAQDATVTEIIIAIDKYKFKLACDVGHMYPLSVVPVVDYMLHKEMEVRNIRMLAHGIDSGLERDELRNLLVI